MNTSNYIGIIADDLTGANDTSLQFFVQGCKTQVAFGEEITIDENLKTEVFALSTESRNVEPQIAVERVKKAAENIFKEYNFEYIYKKIDSVLRGNVANEIITMVEALEYDAAIIFLPLEINSFNFVRIGPAPFITISRLIRSTIFSLPSPSWFLTRLIIFDSVIGEDGSRENSVLCIGIPFSNW